MKTREEERAERREYEGDVYYEAWRRGLDPERAVDCAYDCYDAGRQAEECVDDYQCKLDAKKQIVEEETTQEEQEDF